MDDAQLVRISKALADGTRLGILRTIARRGELCCGDVARCFDVTQATVSHHLKVLDRRRTHRDAAQTGSSSTSASSAARSTITGRALGHAFEPVAS